MEEFEVGADEEGLLKVSKGNKPKSSFESLIANSRKNKKRNLIILIIFGALIAALFIFVPLILHHT
jgi:hypothetical protein